MAWQDVAQAIAAHDPQEAVALSAQIQDPDRRSMVTANTLAALSEVDPRDALRRLEGDEGRVLQDFHTKNLLEGIHRSIALRAFLRGE
jgi:hypothetical protein